MPPPPHPPPAPTDTRILEPDEQWKASLRKRIEHGLLHMVEEAQIVRDTILNSQPSESSRVRAQRDYEESMNNIRTLAQEEFNRILRQEMSERKWAFEVVDSNSSQWSLNNIRKTDEGRTPFPSPDAPQNAKGVLSAGIPRQQSDSDSEQSPDESSEDDDDADDPHRHPPWRHGQGHQPYFAPHGGTERPPTQNRDRIASNISIAPRLRQTSASVSPHDRPSPPTYMTALRTIPGARPPFDEGVRFPTSTRSSSRPMNSMQRTPEEMRQGIAIPRGPTTPDEGPRGTSWGSLNSRRAFGDFNIKDEQRLPPIEGDLSDVSDDGFGHPDGRQNVRSTRNVLSAMNIEQLTAWWETEARRKEDEANHKEEEASRKEEEARRLEEKARQSLEEARRLEAYARQAEASAKTREAEATKRGAEAQKREAEVQRKEEEVRYREIEVRRKEEQARQKEEDARKREEIPRRREEDARQREMLARQKEENARRFEEEARKKEDEARRKEEEARRKKDEAKRIEEDYERKKREIEQKKREIERREAELLRREQAAHLAQEEAVRRAKENSRLEPEGARHGDEDAARFEPEGRHQRELEERLFHEQRLLEERRKQEALRWEREEQIRLDEELSRREQARLDREALLEKERLVAEAHEREAIRVREEQRRVAEEERLRVHEEQRRKAEEKNRQHDELRQQQQQQDEILRQRAWEEQQREFERRAAQYYQRKLDRERQNNVSTSFESRATPHQSGSTTGSAGVRNGASISTTSTWSSRLPPMSSSHNTNSLVMSSSIPFSTTPKPSSTGARPGAPGTSMARALKGDDRYGS
jgi:hypothetical protein